MGWVAASGGSTFVSSSGTRGSALRGHDQASAKKLQFVQYEDAAMAPQKPPAWTSSSSSAALALLAAFGLVTGVVAAPQPARAATMNNMKVVELSDSSVAVALKQYVNPSDEREEDEVEFEDWTAEHPVQFILTCLIPVFIYLTFYILGSLEII